MVTHSNSLDVTQVATTVSSEAFLLRNSRARIGRYTSKNGTDCTAQLSYSSTPITTLKAFWPPNDSDASDSTTGSTSGPPSQCGSNPPLSHERKRSLFWQYHRSGACQEYAAMLGTVLKGLCDAGIPLSHEGRPVVNILILNTTELDVSDLLLLDSTSTATSTSASSSSPSSPCLHVQDPVTQTTLPVLATPEIMDRQEALGQGMCHRMGLSMPEDSPKCRAFRQRLKQDRADSYSGAVPHWWVAVVVEGVNDFGAKEWMMVHLDMCGAAYDETALVSSQNGVGGGGDGGHGNGHGSLLDPELLVPLKVFCTPEYEMMANLEPELKHKLILKPFISERNADSIQDEHSTNAGTLSISLQPKSNRYFRMYHKDDTSSIEVTPLSTYLDRQPPNPKMDAGVSDIIKSIQTKVLPTIAKVGSKVKVCNIQSKPELNGREGKIHPAFSTTRKNSKNGRIPVMIQGLSKPVQLKPICLKLVSTSTTPLVQYQTKEEILHHQRELLEKDTILNHRARVSKQEKKEINSALDQQDPAVQKVLATISSGQMAFSKFGDPEFKRGFKLLLQPPLCTIFPEEIIPNFKAALNLSNHAKAGKAIRLIQMMKSAKQELLEKDPSLCHGNGAVAVAGDSDLMRLQMSVVANIQTDDGLAHVFERLDELGLYVNPCKAFGL